MSLKKLSRIAVVAFAVALVLAVSSLAAYSFTLEGTVAGLEDGVTYTAAKYDFVNNTYGEFTELTDETVLTSGIWGIKAGDDEPVALFVQGEASGKFNFWDTEKEAIASVFKAATLTDSFVPGYWSCAKDGAFVNATSYAGYPSVCIHLSKAAFLEKAKVADTVTVEEAAYPLYTIDGAKYYLKDGSYYAVADNALYEGESEAVAVTKLTWVGATPIEGEANLLAESEYMYGFTNDQVVPVSAFDNYTSKQITIKVGSVAVNTGYSQNDYKPKVVFYTKQIGSGEISEYVGVSSYSNQVLSATLPANIPADAYIVGVGFRPYDELPDDFFVNNADNTEDRGYYHQWMNKSIDNGLTLKAVHFDAPTGLTGGIFTVNGLEEGKNYQWAPVTLNSTGNGYAVGEWNTLTADTEIAGLVVVRFCNGDGTIFSEASDIIYVSGSAIERQKIGNFKEDNGYVICKSGTSDWLPGYFAGNSAGQVNEGGVLMPYNSLDQSVGTPANVQTLWLYDHTEETAEAKLEAQKSNTYPAWTGGMKAETFQKIIDDFYASKASLTADEWAAERLAHAQSLANTFESRNNRYAYESAEIVPVEDVSSFAFFTRKRQGTLVFESKAKVVFKVMDLDGNVTDYSWTGATKAHGNGGDSGYQKHTVDLTTLFADAEGYLVGFAIYPFGEVDVDTVKVADGQYLAANGVSARFIQNQAEQGWYPDDYKVEILTYPKLEGIKAGFGAVAGLEEGKTYQYATLTINAAGTALEQGNWTDYTDETELVGLVIFREVTRDGGITLPSDVVYVYGDAEARQTLCAVDPSTGKVYATAATNTFKLGYWTGNAAATHSSFTTYAVSTLGAGWISSTAAKAAKEADAALAADPENADLQAAALAKRQALCNAVTNNWLYYGYEPEEIVSITELKSLSFTSLTRQGIAYSKAYASEVAVVVALPDGTVSEHRYITAEAKDGSGNVRNVSFEDASAWTPALPEKGWVVGLKINQWYGKTDPSAWGTSELNSMPTMTFIPEKYMVGEPELVLDPIDADLSGLYLEDGVVKGFDANVSYGVCKATANGLSAIIAELPAGATSYELETGLWAFKVLGDGITIGDSLPSQVFYKAGNSRGNILHTETVTCTGMKETSPINGEVVERIIAKTAGKTGAVEFNDGVWTATHAYSNNLYVYWEQGSPLNLGSTSNPISCSKVTSAMTELEADPENAELQAKVAQLVAENIAFTNSIGYAYQFTQDEIIPMADFASHTFKAWCRQTGLAVKSGTFQTKYVLKVMLDDGSIVDRVVYKDVIYAYNAGTVMTVELSDFTETDGYIVGMVIYPYGNAVNVEFKKGSMPDVSGDVDVMFYADGYRAIAPAPAPKFDIVAAVNGTDVVIKDAIEGATYAWSIDGIEWTSGDAGFAVMKTTAKSGDTIYVKMLPFETYLESYVANAVVPTFKAAPELVLGEGNVLSDTTGAYEIAKYSFNSELVYETLTEKTLTTGVWAVRTIGDDTAGASAPQVFYIKGDQAGTLNLVNTTSTSFVEGMWATSISSSMYASVTAWESAGKIEIHTGSVFKLNDRRNYAVKYLMAEDEIVPVSELVNINIGATAFYTGYINEGYTKDDLVIEARAIAKKGQTMARVHVVGASVDYYDVYTDIAYSTGYDFNVGDALADKEGYAVAIELYPLWKVYGADGKTELGDSAISACWNHQSGNSYYESYTFKMTFGNQFIENELPEGESLPTGNYWNAIYADGTNRYGIKLAKTQAEAPVLTINVKNVITVSNYLGGAKYAYSTDGGETWTEFAGSSFSATKANATYLVKVKGNSSFYESEASSITSNPLTVVGTSLVLDGQIGVRVYFDIDTDLVNVDKVYLYSTKINTDFARADGGDNGYREYGSVTSTASSAKWASKLLFDEAKGLYYITVFVPAKDFDNIHIENELQYYLKATEEGAEDIQVKYYNIGTDFKVSTYINQAKELAAAGNEEFVAALDLINATDDYVTYADAYFHNKTVDSYKTEAAVEVEAASRSNAALTGVEFYGTSLILEDNVTIRHYFKVNDIDAFVQAGYVLDVDYGTKGDYIYFDITDIPAQELGTQQTLTIKDAEGNAVYTVNYAATNYMADMMDDSNANLASLVNVMYDYYLAAVDYSK